MPKIFLEAIFVLKSQIQPLIDAMRKIMLAAGGALDGGYLNAQTGDPSARVQAENLIHQLNQICHKLNQDQQNPADLMALLQALQSKMRSIYLLYRTVAFPAVDAEATRLKLKAEAMAILKIENTLRRMMGKIYHPELMAAVKAENAYVVGVGEKPQQLPETELYARLLHDFYRHKESQTMMACLTEKSREQAIEVLKMEGNFKRYDNHKLADEKSAPGMIKPYAIKPYEAARSHIGINEAEGGFYIEANLAERQHLLERGCFKDNGLLTNVIYNVYATEVARSEKERVLDESLNTADKWQEHGINLQKLLCDEMMGKFRALQRVELLYNYNPEAAEYADEKSITLEINKIQQVLNIHFDNFMFKLSEGRFHVPEGLNQEERYLFANIQKHLINELALQKQALPCQLAELRQGILDLDTQISSAEDQTRKTDLIHKRQKIILNWQQRNYGEYISIQQAMFRAGPDPLLNGSFAGFHRGRLNANVTTQAHHLLREFRYHPMHGNKIEDNEVTEEMIYQGPTWKGESPEETQIISSQAHFGSGLSDENSLFAAVLMDVQSSRSFQGRDQTPEQIYARAKKRYEKIVRGLKAADQLTLRNEELDIKRPPISTLKPYDYHYFSRGSNFEIFSEEFKRISTEENGNFTPTERQAKLHRKFADILERNGFALRRVNAAAAGMPLTQRLLEGERQQMFVPDEAMAAGASKTVISALFDVVNLVWDAFSIMCRRNPKFGAAFVSLATVLGAGLGPAAVASVLAQVIGTKLVGVGATVGGAIQSALGVEAGVGLLIVVAVGAPKAMVLAISEIMDSENQTIVAHLERHFIGGEFLVKGATAKDDFHHKKEVIQSLVGWVALGTAMAFSLGYGALLPGIGPVINIAASLLGHMTYHSLLEAGVIGDVMSIKTSGLLAAKIAGLFHYLGKSEFRFHSEAIKPGSEDAKILQLFIEAEVLVQKIEDMRAAGAPQTEIDKVKAGIIRHLTIAVQDPANPMASRPGINPENWQRFQEIRLQNPQMFTNQGFIDFDRLNAFIVNSVLTIEQKCEWFDPNTPFPLAKVAVNVEEEFKAPEKLISLRDKSALEAEAALFDKARVQGQAGMSPEELGKIVRILEYKPQLAQALSDLPAILKGANLNSTRIADLQARISSRIIYNPKTDHPIDPEFLALFKRLAVPAFRERFNEELKRDQLLFVSFQYDLQKLQALCDLSPAKVIAMIPGIAAYAGEFNLRVYPKGVWNNVKMAFKGAWHAGMVNCIALSEIWTRYIPLLSIKTWSDMISSITRTAMDLLGVKDRGYVAQQEGDFRGLGREVTGSQFVLDMFEGVRRGYWIEYWTKPLQVRWQALRDNYQAVNAVVNFFLEIGWSAKTFANSSFMQSIVATIAWPFSAKRHAEYAKLLWWQALLLFIPIMIPALTWAVTKIIQLGVALIKMAIFLVLAAAISLLVPILKKFLEWDPKLSIWQNILAKGVSLAGLVGRAPYLVKIIAIGGVFYTIDLAVQLVSIVMRHVVRPVLMIALSPIVLSVALVAAVGGGIAKLFGWKGPVFTGGDPKPVTYDLIDGKKTQAPLSRPLFKTVLTGGLAAIHALCGTLFENIAGYSGRFRQTITDLGFKTTGDLAFQQNGWTGYLQLKSTTFRRWHNAHIENGLFKSAGMSKAYDGIAIDKAQEVHPSSIGVAMYGLRKSEGHCLENSKSDDLREGDTHLDADEKAFDSDAKRYHQGHTLTYSSAHFYPVPHHDHPGFWLDLDAPRFSNEMENDPLLSFP